MLAHVLYVDIYNYIYIYYIHIANIWKQKQKIQPPQLVANCFLSTRNCHEVPLSTCHGEDESDDGGRVDAGDVNGWRVSRMACHGMWHQNLGAGCCSHAYCESSNVTVCVATSRWVSRQAKGQGVAASKEDDDCG